MGQNQAIFSTQLFSSGGAFISSTPDPIWRPPAHLIATLKISGGWDSQYLQDTVQTAVTDASKEYLAYLGPGNLSEDRARHILEEVKDAAMAAAHAGDW